MARMKKSPTKAMVDATERLAGIKSINAALDLGNGLSVAAFEAKINAVYDILDEHNTLLSQIDQKANVFETNEKELRDTNERFLLAIAAKYGKDSDEYEMAGGKRKSERRRLARKEKTE